MHLLVFFIFALLDTSSFASSADCKPIANGILVRRFTNYAPSAGGINGRCGQSASGRDPCVFSLEDHLDGRVEMVIGAVPQRGSMANLFGGIYLAKALQSALKMNQCIRVFAGDRLGLASNNRSQIDIATQEEASDLADLVNRARGELLPLGRAPGLPEPKRQIKRDPRAVRK